MSFTAKILRARQRFIGELERRAAQSIKDGSNRYCPICESHSGNFLSFGVPPRQDVRCPHCDSLERHRLLWLFLQQETDLFSRSDGKMLHVAPEKCLRGRFARTFGGDYITADYLEPDVDVKMDIQDIQFGEQSFDVIYCSHVLEHVEDDRKAMKEFHRILKKDGWAIVMVPIYSEPTYEDPQITDPQERLKHFGQIDHVRRYGPDFLDRLVDAGFRVRTAIASELEKPNVLGDLRLSDSNTIYYCRKS